MDLFDGIDGVEGRVPFGAIVTVGTKGDRGNPTRTNRFFLVSTGLDEIGKGGKGYRNLRHPMDPRFQEFNALKDDDRRASVLRGNLVFPRQGDSLNYHLIARQLGANGKHGPTPHGGGTWETPPRAMPACVGDGKRAKRYAGQVDEMPHFVDINCPNRLCPFRQGAAKVCGAFARLYFRLRWPDGNPLPSILVRYQTHGWTTTENLLGLFQSVEQAAEGLGMDRSMWTFAGLPFELSVGLKRQPDQGRRYPVVAVGMEDVMGFLHWQVEQRKYLQAGPVSVALLGDGLEHGEETMEAMGEALDQVVPSRGIPATVDVQEAQEAQEEPPAVEAYVVDPADPRSPVDRLEEFAVDALGLAPIDLRNAAQKVAGCNPEAVTQMFEAAVAEELERAAETRRSERGQA